MKRKTPVRHTVRKHKREGKTVDAFTRGRGQAQRRNSKVVGAVSDEFVPDWIDLDDIVQAVGRYKIGKIVETYPSKGEANVHWVHPITEEPTGARSVIPIKDLRKVIEVSGSTGIFVALRDKDGNLTGHKKMKRYNVVVEDKAGKRYNTEGPVHRRRSPKMVRDLRRKYRRE